MKKDEIMNFVKTLVMYDKINKKDRDKAISVAKSITPEMLDSLEAKVLGWDPEGSGYYIEVEGTVVSAIHEMSIEDAKIIYLLGEAEIEFDMTYCPDDELPDAFKDE